MKGSKKKLNAPLLEMVCDFSHLTRKLPHQSDNLKVDIPASLA
jgi:hypothetical protein